VCSLAAEDGADPDVIETRVTHNRKTRNVFDSYNRGLHWGANVRRDLEAPDRARTAKLDDRAPDRGRRRARSAAFSLHPANT
jgi:hypothetical protein